MNLTLLNNPAEIPSPSPAKFAIRTPSQLAQRCEELRTSEFLIKDFMPRQSLTISIGDSGIGKTPLQYQKAICVAAGLPFLDMPVQQGRVLYLDCENGIAEVSEMVSRISKFLRLPKPPEDLHLWNLNDAEHEFGQPGHRLPNMLAAIRPALVIADPYNAIFTTLEKDNSTAGEEIRAMRGMMKEFRCAFDGLHHIRKRDLNDSYQALEAAALRDWFQQTRGPRILINGSDLRVGIDESMHHQNALLLRGFRRVDGEFPAIHLKRVLDEDGDPMGYQRMAGIDLVRNPDHQALYERLPAEFSFKDAKRIYSKADEATSGALKALSAAGLVQRVQKGCYRKVMQPASQPAGSALAVAA